MCWLDLHYLRYCEALGRDIGDIPAGLYPGIYLRDIGEALVARDGKDILISQKRNGCLLCVNLQLMPLCRASRTI